MSAHPNFFDRLAVKIYSRYLYPGQSCQTDATTNVGIIHKVPDIHNKWKVMDYIYLKKGSFMKYLGLAKKLKLEGEIEPSSTILELIDPEVDDSKSPGKHAGPRDIICITPFDRKFISAAEKPSQDLMQRLSDVVVTAPEINPN